MKTSFLICNYNSDDLLLRCISSIISLNNINIDIYIYDNCSTDNSLDLVIAKFNNNVHIVRGNNNLGYPKAINSIAKIATGENIFILNPNTHTIMCIIIMPPILKHYATLCNIMHFILLYIF